MLVVHQSIEIPDSVTSIESGAFEGCRVLESITIHNPNCNIYDSASTIYNYYKNGYNFTGSIYGYANSTAQKYARKYDYKFKNITGGDILSEGDANGDGSLNVRDAAYIAKMLARSKGVLLPHEADFNKDGKINVRDAAAIAKFLATGKR